MKDFLRRLKLIDHLKTTLPTSQADFINRLNEITDRGSTGIMSDTFDIFSSSKNEFKGQVNFDNFKIKRKRRFFDTRINSAIATGTFTHDQDNLIIETEINGMSNLHLIFYGFISIFYSVFIIGFLISGGKDRFLAIPFVLLHGAFMFGIPYFMIKRSVKQLKYELEREFFYLTIKH